MRSLLVLAVLTSTAHALPPAPPFIPATEPNITFNKRGYYELHRTEGGRLDGFNEKFRGVEATGFPVRVKEDCWSACTIILRNPKACAEPSAILGFHQALKLSDKNPGYYEYASEGTYWLWNFVYPEAVKAKLGKLTPQMVYLKGDEIMPTCK